MHRKISVALVFLFLAGLVMVELKHSALLPPLLISIAPDNHFHVVHIAFSAVLLQELISLIFTIPCSFSRSVGKQFEILALILLRNAFKVLAGFQEPIGFANNETAVLHILANGFGALLVFGLLGYYYRIQAPGSETKLVSDNLYSFVAAKKAIALVLLIVFIVMGIRSGWSWLQHLNGEDFFHTFYTILILADILVVLLAQCFQPSFHAMFRNSGLALSTLMIRLALAAPPFYNVLLGLAAIIFAILLTLISTTLFRKKRSSPS